MKNRKLTAKFYEFGSRGSVVHLPDVVCIELDVSAESKYPCKVIMHTISGHSFTTKLKTHAEVDHLFNRWETAKGGKKWQE